MISVPVCNAPDLRTVSSVNIDSLLVEMRNVKYSLAVFDGAIFIMTSQSTPSQITLAS
jgi:hypothetical protein